MQSLRWHVQEFRRGLRDGTDEFEVVRRSWVGRTYLVICVVLLALMLLSR